MKKIFIIILLITAMIFLVNILPDACLESMFNSNLVSKKAPINTASIYEVLPNQEKYEDSIPEVELKLGENKKNYTWNKQVRYSILVSDKIDGSSKYDEINNNEVFLSIKYVPGTADLEKVARNLEVPEKEPYGLSLMKQSTCFGCHADKSSLTGPSFAEIAQEYRKDLISTASLAKSISKGSSQKWGNSVMPAHPDFTKEETEKMVKYIIAQGGNENIQILPGLEGAFSIREKPENIDQAVYVIIASYTSKSGKMGYDFKLLSVQ